MMAPERPKHTLTAAGGKMLFETPVSAAVRSG